MCLEIVSRGSRLKHPPTYRYLHKFGVHGCLRLSAEAFFTTRYATDMDPIDKT